MHRLIKRKRKEKKKLRSIPKSEKLGAEVFQKRATKGIIKCIIILSC